MPVLSRHFSGFATNQELIEKHYCPASTLVRIFLDCVLVLSVPVEQRIAS